MRAHVGILLFAILTVKPAMATPKRSELVTSEFGDSTTVKVCNCVATVQVRARSLGPGACAVKIRTAQDEVGLLAPPSAWTAWTDVYEHTGATSIRIDREVVCDTGVRTQVRYYR